VDTNAKNIAFPSIGKFNPPCIQNTYLISDIMPNLLIISSCFPPQSDVGGIRPAMMAKYLRAYGWKIYVLTRDYGNDSGRKDLLMDLGRIVPENDLLRIEVSSAQEIHYLKTRGLLGKLRDVLMIEKAFPPGVFDSLWPVAVDNYGKRKNHIDAIWATAPDFAPIRIGRDLSVLLGVPYVADFRDITEQESTKDCNWRRRLLRIRANIRRKMLVRKATFLTSVSSYHCHTLSAKTGKPCNLIYNGYDSDLFQPVPPTETNCFRIVYMGRILSINLQNPILLFEALDSLIYKGQIDPNKVEILFYATEPELVKSITKRFRSSELCRLHSRIDYKDVPKILSSSSLLLLLTEYERKGILTTKLFEYLAMERPILCVRTETDSEIASIVKKAKVGYAGDNLEAAKKFILNCYTQWRLKGYSSVDPDRAYIEQFSRKQQAKNLSDLLYRVIDPSKDRKLTG